MGDELDETLFPSFDYGVTQVEVSSSMILVRFSREVHSEGRAGTSTVDHCDVWLGRGDSLTFMLPSCFIPVGVSLLEYDDEQR